MKSGLLTCLLSSAAALSLAVPGFAEVSQTSCSADYTYTAAAAQDGKKASEKAPAPAPKFKPAGIKMGNGVVRPGDDLQIVFSVFGPPDQILPMRAKSKEADDDYIHFIYRNRFTVNINKQNMIQSMTVLTNNIGLDGIPFKIGQSTKDVTKEWKEPEREASGMLIYYYRGVYIITEKDAPEKIDRIYMTAPGTTEEEKQKSAN